MEVVADFALASLIKQRRLQRVLGDAPSWHLDVEEGWAQIGDARFRADIVGTEASASSTFAWAWANPAFAAEHTLTAQLLRRVGAAWEIDTLLDDGELPVDRVDGHVAGVIGSGIGEADAYYVGHHAGGAVVFLLRHRVLRDVPFSAAADLVPALDQLAAGDLAVDIPTALEAFAEDPLDGFAVEPAAGGALIHAPGGRVRIELDRRGRVTDLHADLDAAIAGVPGEREPPEVLTAIGAIDLPAGPLAVFDPLVAVDPILVAPRPGTLPGGRHPVTVVLDDEDGGGDERVARAQLVLDPAPVAAWQRVGFLPVDSGIACFAAPQAAEALVEGGEAALEALVADLAAASRDTWQHAAWGDGLVAFTTGLGSGEYDLAWGFDAEDRLVRVAIDVLPDEPLGPPDEEVSSPAEAPDRGLERALLFPLAAGGDVVAENALVLPPAAHRRLTALHRRMLRQTLAGHDIEGSVVPEYDSDDEVPSRIRVAAAGGAAPFAETIEVAAAG